LPHLFEPFYTTKTDGVDLGLWISYDLIEQNGGSLMVENLIEPPRVCFTVKMPLSPQTDGANNGA
jgi:C4-dicarboxylate-specific signal transduction histidine kinase